MLQTGYSEPGSLKYGGNESTTVRYLAPASVYQGDETTSVAKSPGGWMLTLTICFSQAITQVLYSAVSLIVDM
jgi:hypothetical protein